MIYLINFIIFIIYLFRLYKLVKDDHVFLRKNIKIEEFFDISFFAIFVGFITVQILSPWKVEGFTFFVLSSFLTVFLIGKYKNYPLGRYFDFFTLSFLNVLPFIFFSKAIFDRGVEIFVSLALGFIYLIFAVIFNKPLLSKILNRTLMEGYISIFFLVLFAIFSLPSNIIKEILSKESIVNPSNIVLLLTLILGIILLLRQHKD